MLLGWSHVAENHLIHKKKQNKQSNLKGRYLRRADCLAGEGDAILVCNKLLPAMHVSFG